LYRSLDVYNKRHAHKRSKNTSTYVSDRITAVHSFNTHFSYGQLWLFNNTASLNELRDAEWETLAICEQAIPDIRSSYVPEGPAQFEFSLRAVYSIRIYHGVQRTSEIQNTGIWRAAAWQPHRFCDRPAGFFRHRLLIANSFPHGKIGALFKNVMGIFYPLKIAFRNCVT